MNQSWKSEQDRQAQELTEILEREIHEYGKRLVVEGKQPLLNAVASALVSAAGAMLASVGDRRLRKELRQVMDRGLPRAIAAHEGRVGTTKIMVAGRRADA